MRLLPPQTSAAERRTLVAAALGWMLDAFDVMLYALVLARLMTELSMSKATAGLLSTLTLVASGLGGVLFGHLGDLLGRRRALMLSILTYSVCSLLSGLSTSVAMLAACRFVLGLGMGGEWNTGAALVAETWRAPLRARALALVQSSWALGYAAAALVAGLLLPRCGWRAVFFVGALPALLVLWVRRGVPESILWQQHAAPGRPATARIGLLLLPPHRRGMLLLLTMNLAGMFAWWGLFTWVPAYLQLPQAQGGRGLSQQQTTVLLVLLNLGGMLPGYASFGWIADRLGRRRALLLFTLTAALLVPLYAQARGARQLLLLGAPLAFFGTGFFSGSGIVGSELFPTALRARALGLTYGGARTLSAVAPFVIGWVGTRRGLSGAFLLCSAGYLLAALSASRLPETRGRSLG